MMGWSPRCYIPSFVEIGPPVLEKIFEGFLPYMGVVAHKYRTKYRSPYKWRLNLALIGPAVSEIFEHCERRTTPDHEYPISSPVSPAQVS